MTPKHPIIKLFIIAINMTFALVLSSPMTRSLANVTHNPIHQSEGLEEEKVEVSEEVWIEDIESSGKVPMCHLVRNRVAFELFGLVIMILVCLGMVYMIARTRRMFQTAFDGRSGPPPVIVAKLDIGQKPKVKLLTIGENDESGEKIKNSAGDNSVSDSTFLSSTFPSTFAPSSSCE